MHGPVIAVQTLRFTEPLRSHSGTQSQRAFNLETSGADHCQQKLVRSPHQSQVFCSTSVKFQLTDASYKMDLNAQKDHFSRAIVRAIAATAGVTATVPEHDQDSLDMTYAAPDTSTTPGAKLDAQLKCSHNIQAQGDHFSFPLPVKNYDDLRWPPGSRYVPRILIVVHVPSDPTEWLVSDPEQMTLRRCAYWVSLAGAVETDNTSTVSVSIPIEQVFDPAALTAQLTSPGAAL